MRLYLILLIAISIFCQPLLAQHNLLVQVENKTFMPGDTIRMECSIPAWEGTKEIGTLNILIEDVNHRNFWQLRYPLVDGYCEPSFILPDSFPTGHYSVKMQLQSDFFLVQGNMLLKYKEDSIRYTMMLADNSIVEGILPVSATGTFKLPRFMYSDRALLYFIPLKNKKARNTLDIAINTPLDSNYKPVSDTSFFVSVGVEPETLDTLSFFSENQSFPKETLDNVTVIAKAKTPVEKYDAENASGFFAGGDARIFSGLDGGFSSYVSIFDYLQGKIAGLQIQRNGESAGGFNVIWRGQRTAFFLDEIATDAETINNLPVNDIAMVKIFQPPFMGVPFGGGGGAIAIYSKRGAYGSSTPRFQNVFVVYGYSPLQSTLIPKTEN